MESRKLKKNNFFQYKYALLWAVTFISALKYDLQHKLVYYFHSFIPVLLIQLILHNQFHITLMQSLL